MKIVHAADLHLDSPLRGLVRYEGAPVEALRGATRRAFDNLVQLCVDERPALLLLAGDLYDGDWPDYATGLCFRRGMVRVREAGVRVVLIRGNHDAQSQITRSLTLPEGVHRLSETAPETVVFEDVGVAVHGQGFETRAVESDLAAAYPERREGLLNVGLLHTALEGRPGHDPYAPTRVRVLEDKGYDYWALGHVHAREVVRESPWIVFPGNLQGRHARETGAKGATVIEVEAGAVRRVEHRALDVVRWAHLEVDATGASRPDDLVDRGRAALEEAVGDADGRLLAARVVFRGACEAHARLQSDVERWESELRGQGFELGAEACWIEKVRFETTQELDREALAERDDPVGRVLRRLGRMPADGEELQLLRDALGDFITRLPRGARRGPEAVDLDDEETLAALLRDAEGLLLARLLERSDEP